MKFVVLYLLINPKENVLETILQVVPTDMKIKMSDIFPEECISSKDYVKKVDRRWKKMAEVRNGAKIEQTYTIEIGSTKTIEDSTAMSISTSIEYGVATGEIGFEYSHT